MLKCFDRFNRKRYLMVRNVYKVIILSITAIKLKGCGIRDIEIKIVLKWYH